MKTNYTISVAAGSQLDAAAGINMTVLPLLAQAVRAVAQQAAAEWKESVYKAKLWSGEKDAYANSIQWFMTGDFSARVESDYKHAQAIETGRPAYDMKRMLDTSSKIRRTLDGRRFLVIPMRQNTPGNTAHAGAMPGSVHALAQKMAPSKITAQTRRPTGEITHLSPKTGMHPASKQTPFLSNVKTKKALTVPRNKYAWGDRLTASALRESGASKEEVRRYKGMVRFDTSTPQGGKSSSYLTFRIMMDGQSGKWIIPAKPGLHLLNKVAASIQPKAEAAFAAAIKATVQGS